MRGIPPPRTFCVVWNGGCSFVGIAQTAATVAGEVASRSIDGRSEDADVAAALSFGRRCGSMIAIVLPTYWRSTNSYHELAEV